MWKSGPDYPLGTMGTVHMAHEEIVAYKAVNAVCDFKWVFTIFWQNWPSILKVPMAYGILNPVLMEDFQCIYLAGIAFKYVTFIWIWIIWRPGCICLFKFCEQLIEFSWNNVQKLKEIALWVL